MQIDIESPGIIESISQVSVVFCSGNDNVQYSGLTWPSGLKVNRTWLDQSHTKNIQVHIRALMTNPNRNALKNTSVPQIQIIQNYGVLCAYFFLRGGVKQSQFEIISVGTKRTLAGQKGQIICDAFYVIHFLRKQYPPPIRDCSCS